MSSSVKRSRAACAHALSSLIRAILSSFRTQRQRGRRLDLGQHQAGVDARHAGHGRQLLDHEALQVLAVAHHDLEQEVELAGDVVTFQHFGKIAHTGAELLQPFRAGAVAG